MNLSCPVPEKLKFDIGSRTDVLYHVLIRQYHTETRPDLFPQHTVEQVQGWKKDGLQWLVTKLSIDNPRVQAFAGVANGVIPWVTLPVKRYRFLNEVIGGAPNMGVIAMYHLLQAPIKELHVVGCDFHTRGYYNGYGGFNENQAALGAGGGGMWGQARTKNGKTRRIHKLDGQLQFLRQLYRDDHRFKPDDILLSILEGVK